MEQQENQQGQPQRLTPAEGAMGDILEELEKYFAAEQSESRTLAAISQISGKYIVAKTRRNG